MQRPYKISVGLSQDAKDLIASNEIKNISEFIDELLVETLQEKKFWAKKMNYHLIEAAKCGKKAGINTDFIPL